MGQLTLTLFGEINEQSVTPVLQQLIQHPVGDPVIIFISSEGGDLYFGLALMDVLSQHDTTTVGIGLVGSSALSVFLAGKHRYISDYGRLLLHQSRWSPDEMSESDVADMSTEITDTNAKLRELYCLKSNVSPAAMKKLFYRDSYMSPQKAVEYGFATGLWHGQGLGCSLSEEIPTGFRATAVTTACGRLIDKPEREDPEEEQ